MSKTLQIANLNTGPVDSPIVAELIDAYADDESTSSSALLLYLIFWLYLKCF